ncbi:hypothetical protein QGM71_06325 [Virgibacillus sp. C22-A2]|uniref:Uncharacterized protein n=1 Tax=Virgibacillus tibetensis TaxID=3042313 RepID=A0ABU6KD80_9BACI|nr:hypothetical protein [Virgibacillus sp. C22-A2]
MKKQDENKLNFRKDEGISVHNGLRGNPPLKKQNNYAGDSVNKHKELEAANEVIAEKEISQVYNNS